MHIQAGTNSNRSQQCDIHNDIWGNTLLFLLAEGTNESWLHPLLLWNRARDCSMQRTADLRWFCCYLINKIHYQQRQKRGTSNNLHFSFGLCLLSPYSQPLPPIVSCGAEIAVQAHLFPRRQPRPRLDPSDSIWTPDHWRMKVCSSAVEQLSSPQKRNSLSNSLLFKEEKTQRIGHQQLGHCGKWHQHLSPTAKSSRLLTIGLKRLKCPTIQILLAPK